MDGLWGSCHTEILGFSSQSLCLFSGTRNPRASLGQSQGSLCLCPSPCPQEKALPRRCCPADLRVFLTRSSQAPACSQLHLLPLQLWALYEAGRKAGRGYPNTSPWVTLVVILGLENNYDCKLICCALSCLPRRGKASCRYCITHWGPEPLPWAPWERDGGRDGDRDEEGGKESCSCVARLFAGIPASASSPPLGSLVPPPSSRSSLELHVVPRS